MTSIADTQATEAHNRYSFNGMCLQCGCRWPCRTFLRTTVKELTAEHDRLLADNARLTAALADAGERIDRYSLLLAEAEGERDRLQDVVVGQQGGIGPGLLLTSADVIEWADKKLKAALMESTADAATGRAVARRLWALLVEARECEALQDSNSDLCERIDWELCQGHDDATTAEATYLVSLSDEPT